MLQKHGQRLGRAQEQHSVHLGDIHTLVVNVHHKEESELPGNQPLFGGVALLVRRIAGQCHRRDAVGIKVARHKLGMSNGNAEAQTLHIVDIGDIFQDGVHHKVSAALRHHAAEGVQVGQLVFIVAAGTPFQAAQICGVGDAEILEGTEQFPVNRFRQTDLGGNASAEIVQNAFAVHTFRGSGQPQQDLRLIIFQQLLISGCSCMMELVYNDVIVKIRCRFSGKLLRIEGLDGNKQMINAVGSVTAHIQFTEIGIFQYRPEGVQALLQDLLPVCHKQ